MSDSSIDYLDLMLALYRRGIAFEEPLGTRLPKYAAMRDTGAAVPHLVISPRSEWGLSETLRLLHDSGLYEHHDVAVRSGGTSISNRATCDGIMINVAGMSRVRIVDDILVAQPGTPVAHLIDLLAHAGKAVPHGAHYHATAGGQFLAGGCDIALSRKYGFSAHSLIGGRVVLWNGQVVDVDEHRNADLLWAMRGAAGAGVGVVSELQVQLIDEPEAVAWCSVPLDGQRLATCLAEQIVERACGLPREISVTLRVQFESHRVDPVCLVDVHSLWGARETMEALRAHLGTRTARLLCVPEAWSEGSLLDIRLLPASDFLYDNPGMLAEVSDVTLRENPDRFWETATVLRQVHASRMAAVSSWVVPDSGQLLQDLFDAFHEASDRRHRSRMHAELVIGGGRALELAETGALPIGEVLARVEIHWDDADPDEAWCETFAERVRGLVTGYEDRRLEHPERGDAWLPSPEDDVWLGTIAARYRCGGREPDGDPGPTPRLVAVQG